MVLAIIIAMVATAVLLMLQQIGVWLGLLTHNVVYRVERIRGDGGALQRRNHR